MSESALEAQVEVEAQCAQKKAVALEQKCAMDGTVKQLRASCFRLQEELKEDEAAEALFFEQLPEQALSDAADPVEAARQSTSETASLNSQRVELQLEERQFRAQQSTLSLSGLETYLQASRSAAELENAVTTLKRKLQSSLSRVDTLTAERGRIFLEGVKQINSRFRALFRALCHDGDCCLEMASTPAVLFSEGLTLSARPPRSEWTRFEQLSGGQKALCAVSLQLALRAPDERNISLFDEIDAALDAQRTQALAQYMIGTGQGQSIFVSLPMHRSMSCPSTPHSWNDA